MLTDDVIDQMGDKENPLTRDEIMEICRKKGINPTEEEI